MLALAACPSLKKITLGRMKQVEADDIEALRRQRPNLERWLAWREAAERPVPGYVEDELRSYLECGILCFGFARADPRPRRTDRPHPLRAAQTQSRQLGRARPLANVHAAGGQRRRRALAV